MIKQFALFDVRGYQLRLQLLRSMYNETQDAFAHRLGIPFKRWNQYERGYPIPRETAFLIRQKISPGIIEWIWFGDESGISEAFRQQLRAAELAQRVQSAEHDQALRERQKRAKKALKKLKAGK